MKQPKTVVKLWEALCAKVKADKTKRKAPGRAEARKHAALCGMRSMGEVYCASDLDARGKKYEYEARRLTYQYDPQTYTPDFVLPNGVIVEFKGKMVGETRKKLLAIRRCNPNLTIGIVFQKANNKLSTRPNSKRYWEWAEASGFLYSESFIPDAWFNIKPKKGKP